MLNKVQFKKVFVRYISKKKEKKNREILVKKTQNENLLKEDTYEKKNI